MNNKILTEELFGLRCVNAKKALYGDTDWTSAIYQQVC